MTLKPQSPIHRLPMEHIDSMPAWNVTVFVHHTS